METNAGFVYLNHMNTQLWISLLGKIVDAFYIENILNTV